MAEEGGGGHGDSGSSSAIGSTQRLPPPPPPQPPQPGSQAPPAPALAPDQLPQNNTLVALPIVAIENILSFMSYDEISQLRLVRPPRDPRRPLRRAEVWGGTEMGARSRGGRPASPAGARAGARPSRPKVSLGACQRGLSPGRPRLGAGGDCLGQLGLGVLRAPPPGSGAGGGGSWAPRLCPARAWTPEWARPLPFVHHPPAPAGSGDNSQGGEVTPRSQPGRVCPPEERIVPPATQVSLLEVKQAGRFCPNRAEGRGVQPTPCN